MQRPDGMTSAEVTASQQADAAAESQGAPSPTLHAAPWRAPRHDAAEAALCRRARRQGFCLAIASSAAMIILILCILIAFR